MGACVRFYRSKDGDTADSIAWIVYGRQDGGVVEALIEANPGLADVTVLEAGLRLVIPDAPAPQITREVRLWD